MKVVILYDGVAINWTAEEIASVMRPVREIARMLGGDPDSQRSREHARELLQI